MPLKSACTILFALFYCLNACSQQFYIRGEVRDEAGNLLQNATILHLRTGYVYHSGSEGTFGILNERKEDSLRITMPGFETQFILANAEKYVSAKLRKLSLAATSLRRDKLASLTRGLGKEDQQSWFTGDETYASIVENHFVEAKRFPVTGMSLNVDRASYSNIRRFINLHSQVPPDAVRIEEMINYFNLHYQEPPVGETFRARTTLTQCPWNAASQLLFVNLCSRKLDRDLLPPSNLVFLIDVSGSMDMPNRLPLLKSAFRLLVNNLRAKDSVAIVVYGGVTGVLMNTTSGAEKDSILRTIDQLEPGGSTPGESGIKLAYSVANNHFITGGNNRVILATDGDFNVGLKTESELDEMITLQRKAGIYLTCLGVGMGNYKDSKIQLLSEKGNGNYAYLDNYQEAEKVLMKEFTQTLYAVADNVYMNVSFNPDQVKQYRLIGFDNKVGALRDSLSAIEGGEIGSGYSLVALFEIALTENGTAAIRDHFTTGSLGTLNLQYQMPGSMQPLQLHYDCPFLFTEFQELDASYRFSAAVALYGSLLKNSGFTRNSVWDDIITLASQSTPKDDPVQQEFIRIVQETKNLYTKIKKKKGGSRD